MRPARRRPSVGEETRTGGESENFSGFTGDPKETKHSAPTLLDG